ncbi:MAG: precorrin-4 C(11)-methyltransferase [Selenomonadaceae bacterium]|nr:precorrin-4 C(11)-methyltransferase [Selenomonadaceae bacterium]
MVHIVGAGSGDVELITLRGKRLLEEADVVIYAGSLVNPELLNFCKPDAQKYNSAQMTLAEVIHVIEQAETSGLTTVRLHTGDPSIYGAIQEQMDELEKRGIEFDVTPGVSSFLAVAATLKQEYTLPGITQTVIITRHGGRTPVPERERLKNLAKHQTTICIFLSIKMIAEVVDDLIEGGFTPNTPIAVVEHASWSDEKIIRGTLATIVEQVKAEEVERTAMIVVGHCLDSHIEQYQQSQLYSPKFSHMFRKAKSK